MKLYVLYDRQQDKLIGELKDNFGVDKRHVYGAVDPAKNENLLQNMIISSSSAEIKSWQKQLIKNMQDAQIIMSDRHGFALEDIVIKELDLLSAPLLRGRNRF